MLYSEPPEPIFTTAIWRCPPPVADDFLAYVPPVIPAAHLLTDAQRTPYRGVFKSRMAEWAPLRAAPTAPAKFYDKELNAIHAGFLLSVFGSPELDAVEPERLNRNGKPKRIKDLPTEVSLGDYVEHLLGYLSKQGFSEEDITSFLTCHAVVIEAGRFVPKTGTFAKFLNAQWGSYRDRHGIPDAALDPNEVVFVVEPVAAKLKPTPANVTAAWEKDLRGEDGAQDELYRLLWLMGLGFVRAKMWDSPNHLSLVQDCVNQSLTSIWESQDMFVGNGYQFYSWCKLIFQRAALKGFWENKNAERIPLEVRDYEKPGMMRDNPAIYNEGPVQYVRKLPDFIQGYDLQICQFIRQGLDYHEIAKTMGLTESGVRGRVAAMRARVRAEKAAKS